MCHPPQIARPVTEEWIAMVLEAMSRQGSQTQVELAGYCKCSQAAISKLLRSPGTVSKYVECVSLALNLDLPGLTPMSSDAKQVVELFESLGDDGQAALIAHAELLAKISDK